MADEDIRDAFETLKRHDGSVAPCFELPLGGDHDRWRWRPGVITAAAGTIVAVVLFALNGLTSPDARDAKGAVAAIPFNEYSELVSRELFAASASDWESPTDFLLDIDLTPTERKQ